jgi:transcriptional regulator GlxA family with amidase domain
MPRASIHWGQETKDQIGLDVTETAPGTSFRRFDDVCTVGLILVPQYSMMALTSLIEPMRVANRCTGRTLFDWRLLTPDGAPVASSSGLEIATHGSCIGMKPTSAAVVCSGTNVTHFDHREIIATLRRLATFGTAIGAVCTGTYVLAKAGLIDGYRATVHWEDYPSLVSENPDLMITQELFEIDRSRFTCAGGTAAIDMMLAIITRDYGPELAAEVTDILVHHRIREANEQQRMDLRSRLGVAHPKLLSVVKRMEETVDSPISCAELARQEGISTRQMERLFSKYLGHSPTRHYLSVRLERARFLLLQTSMPILSVAMACGFVSASHFSKTYHEHFRRTPSMERRDAKRNV